MSFDTHASNGAGRAVLADGPPRENLVRAFPDLEVVRAADDEGPLIMRGHFAVFNEWTEINSMVEGHFMERFAPGAFKKTISESRDRIQVLYDHGLDPAVGRKPIGTIQMLEEDDRGPYFEVALLDAAYVRDDVLPGLRAGLFGSSMLFGTLKPKVERRPRASDHNPHALTEVTHVETRVKEFGPTPFPVYTGATAGLRSMTDEWMRARLDLVQEPRGHATASIPVAVEADPDEEQRNERLYRRSIERLSSTPWAIEVGALATIKGILAERAAGVRLTDEEIQERIGTRRRAEDPAPASPVAVIRLRGPIVPHAGMMTATSARLTSVEDLRGQFRDALASEDVKAILFDIDSPGGDGSLIPEFASEIRAARGDKPIVAIANTTAASAAYWLMSAADEAVVTPSGLVGSIGVYTAHEDLTGMQEKLGIDTTLISAGKYKVEGNPFEPLTDEGRAHIQGIVDEFYGMFVNAVAKGRGVSTAVVRDDFGQGRVVTPTQALEAGMVDRIATYDETLARLQKTAPVSRSAPPEPEPHEATTPLEPEPSEATTREPRFRNDKEWMKWISKT